MSETEILMLDFSENHMEKLFYFCLRKCSNEFDAEDLAQDIALAVFKELRRGVVPENFSAWVWQIARNLYSKWAIKKHKGTEILYDSDIYEFELANDTSIVDEYIHGEDISLLRRELSFISSEYRNIVVAYYIEDMSVHDIARRLSLPEGTVKSKLFRARNILKEGMKMAREFGSLSYNPENVAFINNGKESSIGEPWTILNHKLNKNILLAAYRTPSTAEELAIELGVALPYMEDELEFLVDSTLMKKSGNKYETNFFIVSDAAQDAIFTDLQRIAPELTKAIIEVIEYKTKCLEASGYEWHRDCQAYEDMKWMLLMNETDSIARNVAVEELTERTKRPRGGEWDILGLEMKSSFAKLPPFVGLHGCFANIDFGQYKYQYKGINSQTPVQLNTEEVTALYSAVTGDIKSVSSEMLDKLAEYGYLAKGENGYIPKLAVMCGNNRAMGLSDEERAECRRLKCVAMDIKNKHYKLCRDVIYKEIPDFMKENTNQINIACNTIVTLREVVLQEALRTGYIYYNGGKTEARDRALGAYIVI